VGALSGVGARWLVRARQVRDYHGGRETMAASQGFATTEIAGLPLTGLAITGMTSARRQRAGTGAHVRQKVLHLGRQGAR